MDDIDNLNFNKLSITKKYNIGDIINYNNNVIQIIDINEYDDVLYYGIQYQNDENDYYIIHTELE